MKTLPRPKPLAPSESGFTLIESLLAIVVVAILLSSIAPVVVFSVATRVQARRVELATQAARSYIDTLRAEATTPPPAVGSGVTLATYAAPTSTGTLTCAANAYCTVPAVNLYCIDRDGGGCTATSNRDMLVQAFRYNPNSTDATKGYALGLRVYRADAFATSMTLQAASQQRSSTGGMGRKDQPLVQMQTDITPSSVRYQDFQQRLASPSPTP